MSQSIPRTVSQDSTDGIRKRVCKACDRCRLKKSKCDGAHPCSRCKADNAICVFGERKKSHDKVYPKGYVEMLEQQQSQLVSGLQEMYKRLSTANAWTGAMLSETNGYPLTHDILAALDLLEAKQDGSGEMESFEEDCHKIKDRLLSEGAGYVQRRASFDSDSDQSQRPPHSRNVSHCTPLSTQTPVFRDNFSFGSPASSPTVQSPIQMPSVHRSSSSFAVQPPTNMHMHRQHHPMNQTPLTHSPLVNDPQLYQPGWSIPDMSTPAHVRQSTVSQSNGVLTQHSHDIHRSILAQQQQRRQQYNQHHPQQPAPQAHAAQVISQQQMLQLHRQQPVFFESTEFEVNLPSEYVDAYSPDLQMGGFVPAILPNSTVDFTTMNDMDMELSKFIAVTT